MEDTVIPSVIEIQYHMNNYQEELKIDREKRLS